MDSDFGMMMSGGRGGMQARGDGTVPDKYCTLHVSPHFGLQLLFSGEVIHISSLALLKVRVDTTTRARHSNFL